MPEQTTGNLLELTTQIVAAHLSSTETSADTLPTLIQSVYRALSGVGEPEVELADTQSPAVPVKKSVFPD